ncbi:flagellin [Alphaproteobacteria bacterium]|nr:flagellin [Alphaproteobacteria bacterium]
MLFNANASWDDIQNTGGTLYNSILEFSDGIALQTINVTSIFQISNYTSSNARRVTTEIIPSYGDSLISEASTEFNLTETPSFTMELSNFELLKNFSETFEGGTFNLSGLDVSNVSINQQTGELLLSSLDFENPNDSDSNNVYEFVINYEANGNIFIQNVKINILDVQPSSNTSSTTLETGNNNIGQTTINTSSDHHVSTEFLEYVEQNPGGTFNLAGADSNLENTRYLNTSIAAGVASVAADTSATSTLTIGTNTPSGTAAYSFDETDITDNSAATAITSIVGTPRYALGMNSPTGVSLVDNLDGTFAVTIETDRTGSPLPANASSFTIEIEESTSPGTTVFTHTINLNVTDLTPFIEIDKTNGEISFNNLNLGPGDANADGVYELQLDYCVGLERISELLSIEFNGGQAEVISTSETTPAILTKISQQGLATRLDYQITEARGFKVHSPEDVGDREELKKFIDANPKGTFALSGADAAKFTVDSDGMIKSQSQIDFEKQNSYEFELTYTSGGASYKESYFLTVVDDPADNVKHLRDIGVGTRASSAEAVEILNVALNQLTASRAKLGAIENRLTYNISNLTKASMLTEQASGRITDADFAQETSELAKNQILNQASMAMLSQANQSKQNVLQLLG